MSGHLDGPPPGPPDPPYIPGDLGAPSAKEFARRRAGDRHMSDTIRLCVQTHHPIDPGGTSGRGSGRCAMPDVPPEIAILRDYSIFGSGPDGFVSLKAAETAVLACEKRMATHAAGALSRERERTIAAVTKMVRERTVAEIAEALREHAAHLGNVEGRYYASAANYVERRFAAKEGDCR